MLADTSTPQANAVTSAARWIEAALTGSIATAIAVLAIAAIGFLMMTGRIDLRRGATVVLGCFVLFGASTIASALQSTAQQGAMLPVVAVAPAPPPPSPPPAPAITDPYAGASVPRNR